MFELLTHTAASRVPTMYTGAATALIVSRQTCSSNLILANQISWSRLRVCASHIILICRSRVTIAKLSNATETRKTVASFDSVVEVRMVGPPKAPVELDRAEIRIRKADLKKESDVMNETGRRYHIALLTISILTESNY